MNQENLEKLSVQLAERLNLKLTPTLDSEIVIKNPGMGHGFPTVAGKRCRYIELHTTEPLPEDWENTLLDSICGFAQSEILGKFNGLTVSEIHHQLQNNIMKTAKLNRFAIFFLYERETQGIVRPLEQVVQEMRTFAYYADVILYIDAEIEPMDLLRHLLYGLKFYPDDDLYSELIAAVRAL